MNFNFFDWIQKGVTRSVLLGISDAIEIVGMAPDEETSRNKIFHYLQTEESSLETFCRKATNSSGGSSTGTARKKLGHNPLADISK